MRPSEVGSSPETTLPFQQCHALDAISIPRSRRQGGPLDSGPSRLGPAENFGFFCIYTHTITYHGAGKSGCGAARQGRSPVPCMGLARSGAACWVQEHGCWSCVTQEGVAANLQNFCATYQASLLNDLMSCRHSSLAQATLSLAMSGSRSRRLASAAVTFTTGNTYEGICKWVWRCVWEKVHACSG